VAAARLRHGVAAAAWQLKRWYQRKAQHQCIERGVGSISAWRRSGVAGVNGVAASINSMSKQRLSWHRHAAYQKYRNIRRHRRRGGIWRRHTIGARGVAGISA